ncbi:unnamed protein product, partial [marine sediment metagenome]
PVTMAVAIIITANPKEIPIMAIKTIGREILVEDSSPEISRFAINSSVFTGVRW